VRGKELLHDQHSCAGSAGSESISLVGCSDPKRSGRGRESLNPTTMKVCQGCHHPFAFSKLYNCLQRFCAWDYGRNSWNQICRDVAINFLSMSASKNNWGNDFRSYFWRISLLYPPNGYSCFISRPSQIRL